MAWWGMDGQRDSAWRGVRYWLRLARDRITVLQILRRWPIRHLALDRKWYGLGANVWVFRARLRFSQSCRTWILRHSLHWALQLRRWFQILLGISAGRHKRTCWRHPRPGKEPDHVPECKLHQRWLLLIPACPQRAKPNLRVDCVILLFSSRLRVLSRLRHALAFASQRQRRDWVHQYDRWLFLGTVERWSVDWRA